VTIGLVIRALVFGLVLAFAGGLGSHEARADTRPRVMGAPPLAGAPADRLLEASVVVAYDLPASCPTAGDFERQVEERAPRARFTEDTAARRFRVAAWTEAEEWVGEVTAVPVVDASSVRRVRGATCADVVGALALIVALALDPGALREPAGADEATSQPGAPASVPEQPPQPPTPVVAAPPAPTPPAPPPPDDESSVELRHQRRVRLSLGAEALAALGIAPDTLFGVGFSVDLTPSRDRLWAWLVRLSASGLFPRDLGSPMKARFSGQFLALEGCPVRLPLGTVVSLLPCVGFEGGVLAVDGIDQPGLLSVQNQRALFLAMIEPLRVAVRLGDVFSLEVDGTLKEPLRHDSFEYSRPPVHVHTLPSITGSFGLGFRVNLDFL
jgi:hypothetical protein